MKRKWRKEWERGKEKKGGKGDEKEEREKGTGSAPLIFQNVVAPML